MLGVDGLSCASWSFCVDLSTSTGSSVHVQCSFLLQPVTRLFALGIVFSRIEWAFRHFQFFLPRHTAKSFEITEPLHHEIGIAPRELGGLSQGDLAPGDIILACIVPIPCPLISFYSVHP